MKVPRWRWLTCHKPAYEAPDLGAARAAACALVPTLTSRSPLNVSSTDDHVDVFVLSDALEPPKRPAPCKPAKPEPLHTNENATLAAKKEYLASRVCFHCKEKGNVRRNCPQLQKMPAAQDGSLVRHRQRWPHGLNADMSNEMTMITTVADNPAGVFKQDAKRAAEASAPTTPLRPPRQLASSTQEVSSTVVSPCAAT